MIHGDIRPDYISFSEKAARYILVDRLANQEQPLQTQLNNMSNYKTLYMAPIIFDELSKKANKIKQNSYRSELFSLGLIVLGCFKHPSIIQEFYDFEEKRFDSEQFVELIDEIVAKWTEEPVSSFLQILKTQVLEVDEKLRANPASLLEELKAMPVFAKYFDPNAPAAPETQSQPESVKYYNPFDFVELAKKAAEAEAAQPAPDAKSVDAEFIRINDGMAVNPVAKEKNLIVTSQKTVEKEARLEETPTKEKPGAPDDLKQMKQTLEMQPILLSTEELHKESTSEK